MDAAVVGGMRTYDEVLEVFLAQADAVRRAASPGDESMAAALRAVFKKASTTLSQRFSAHGAWPLGLGQSTYMWQLASVHSPPSRCRRVSTLRSVERASATTLPQERCASIVT